MAIPVASHLDMLSGSKIINLPDPTADMDAANKRYVDSAIEGLNWKDSVRVATSANINLTSPGATLDGVTMTTGDRVLVKGQTLGQENGIYIYNGAAVAMARSLDMNTATEVEQAITNVEEGTSANTSWRQTAVNVTLGTTPLVWTTMGTVAPPASETAAGIIEIATQAEVDAGTSATLAVTPLYLKNSTLSVKRYQTTIGDGSATSFTITHNLNTKDVEVAVFEVGGTFREIIVEIQHTTTTTLTIIFNAAPAAGAYRVVVIA